MNTYYVQIHGAGFASAIRKVQATTPKQAAEYIAGEDTGIEHYGVYNATDTRRYDDGVASVGPSIAEMNHHTVYLNAC